MKAQGSSREAPLFLYSNGSKRGEAWNLKMAHLLIVFRSISARCNVCNGAEDRICGVVSPIKSLILEKLALR